MADVPKLTVEKIMVCIGPGDSSVKLISRGKSMAADLHAKWFAVYVEDSKMQMLPEAERNRALDNLRLAEQLGAEVSTLSGHNAGERIVEFAKQHNITRIITGKPGRSLLMSLLFPSPVDQLVRMSGEIEIIVTSGEPGEERRAPRIARSKGTHLSDYGTGFLFLILATVLCFMMYPFFHFSNLIMVYLLGVMVTATGCGRGPAVLVSFLSVLSFDFFFVPPRFTLTVDDSQYIVTFMVMFLVAVVISHLATGMRQQAEFARMKERQVADMHGLTRQLASIRGTERILQVAVEYLSEILECHVLVLLPDEKGKLHAAAGDPGSVFEKDVLKELDMAHSAYATGQMTGAGTKISPDAEILCAPLRAGDSTLGVLAVRPVDERRSLLPEQLDLLESLSGQVALSLEVEHLAAACLPGQLQ